MPALKALIGSILWSLTAAKFQLANQAIGGVGCHSILLLKLLYKVTDMDTLSKALADLNVVAIHNFTLKPE